MLKRKGAIGDEILQKIFSYFPTLNIVWLMTGKGEMECNLGLENLTVQSDRPIDRAVDRAVVSEPLITYGCKNCYKLEQDIFFLRDVINSNNLSLALYERENGELRAENNKLKTKLKKCKTG